MTHCFFVSDLHGKEDRYRKFFDAILAERPALVFIGGDILPRKYKSANETDDFINTYLREKLHHLRLKLGDVYPRFFVIFGNDDARYFEDEMLALEDESLVEYIHQRKVEHDGYAIYGYSYVPPTPFRLKDWERYDVSRYVEHGCIAPEDGVFTTDVSMSEINYSTIKEQLEELTGADPMERAVFLFHTPPYKTKLDRADLDGKKIDHAPVDVHVGSIAVQRFIEARQPLLTLHGHIHESARITGSWRDRIGDTEMFTGAHDGKALALIRFDLEEPGAATRTLL